MLNPLLPWALLIAFVLALSLSALLVRHATAVAHPNERSSHNVPTPSGGGLAIVVGVTAFMVWYAVQQWSLHGSWFGALLGGGILVAAVGWVDDHRPLAARWRLSVQLLAISLLVWSADLPYRGWFGVALELGLILALCWLLNLYNFMDGIDGIAAVESLTVAVGAAMLLAQQGDLTWVGPLGAIAVTSAGFLVFNWPPARIFMGDTGSGFLGFMLGALLLITVSQGLLTVYSWCILLGVFVSDASLTLIRRAWRGQRIHHAHRSHAYQILSRRWGSHRRVTGVVLLINLFWLWPLAWWAAQQPSWGIALLLVAWMPLLAAEWRIGAGVHND